MSEQRKITLMKCGHVAQGINMYTKAPVCIICYNGVEGPATIPVDVVPSLQGRYAICTYCRSTRPSDLSLPFFEYCPENVDENGQSLDKYYCGCKGWD